MADGTHTSNRLFDTGPGPLRFPETSWSMVAGAGHGDDAAGHLEILAERYWRPVFVLIRMSVRDQERAKDLTQDFFTRFLERDIVSYADRERGRFRTFLSASVKRFLAGKHREHLRRDGRERRLDAHDDQAGTPIQWTAPDADLESRYAAEFLQTAVGSALARMRGECRATNRDLTYVLFNERHATTGAPMTYGDLARRHGLTEKQVEKALSRGRKQFARLFRNEIQQTIAPGSSVDEEIAELLGSMNSARQG